VHRGPAAGRHLRGAQFLRRQGSSWCPLLKAAIAHKGFAFIDVISPCVTFNNHEGSTKSYSYIRDKAEVTPIDFVPMRSRSCAVRSA
jgi:2-oxoglutarate/2-oxoacid ferredoxin oxidoreductase subunit beta